MDMLRLAPEAVRLPSVAGLDGNLLAARRQRSRATLSVASLDAAEAGPGSDAGSGPIAAVAAPAAGEPFATNLKFVPGHHRLPSFEPDLLSFPPPQEDDE